MELWDLYDEKRNIIGEHIRGEELPENGFHLVVHTWIKNKKGQYLISQRSASRKINPLLWECSGGSVLKGENTRQAAVREVKEEVGIDLKEETGKLVFSKTRHYINGEKFNDIMDVWLFEYDGKIDLSKATTDEVADAKWLCRDEIMQLYKDKRLAPTLEYFFEKIDK